MTNTKQLIVFAALICVFALLAFLTYAVFPVEQMAPGQAGIPSATTNIPPWLLGLANAGIIIIFYGLLGLAGYWFAKKLGLPGVFRERAGWKEWLWRPLAIGLGLGLLVVLVDRGFAALGDWQGFPHPPFPFSIVASATAGIGEEILFRAFVLGLWAFLLNLILRRWRMTGEALWIGNVIAGLAFGAGHLPGVMVMLGVSSLASISPLVLGELFLLNGVVGLAAGERYLKQGLVAAVGVHFWTDIVWHVIWPLINN